MRTWGIGLAVLLGATSASFGQGWGGRGGGIFGGRTASESSAAAAMEAHKGKIILLNSNHLFKIDKKTMKVEASVSPMVLYEKAVALARENQFPQHEALANELSGRLRQKQGLSLNRLKFSAIPHRPSTCG